MLRSIVFGLATLAIAFASRQMVGVAKAADGTHNPVSGSQATAQDWDDLFDAIGQAQATMAGAEQATTSGIDWRFDECRFQSLDRGLWTPREERLTAKCATDKWGISLASVSSVVACESGWNRLAYNPNGPYVGLAQNALSAWGGRVSTYGPAAWDHPISARWQNSRSALVVMVRMVHAVGWSPWSCA